MSKMSSIEELLQILEQIRAKRVKLEVEIEEEITRRLLAEQEKEQERAKRVKLEVEKEEEITRRLVAEKKLLSAEKRLLELKNENSLEKLWNEGIPSFELCKVLSSSSQTYTSNHQEAHFIERDIEIKDMILNITDTCCQSSETSMILLKQAILKGEAFSFASETDIQYLVNSLFTDIMRLSDTYKDVDILNEGMMSETETDFSVTRIKPDIWLVKTYSGRPIAVIEVKSPSTKDSYANDKSDTHHILDDKKVIGQLYDYLYKIRNFYHQYDVLGVITTFKHTRMCWFPYSDNYVTNSMHTNPEDACSNITVMEDRRLLHGTKIMSAFNNPYLIHLLSTFMIKSCNAKIYTLPLICSRRQYLIVNEKKRFWKQLKEFNQQHQLPAGDQIILRLPENLPNPRTNPSDENHYLVLRCYKQYEETNKVVLALSVTSRWNLVVIKTFFRENECSIEYDIWKNIYKVNTIKQNIYGKLSLIMPFVFTCVKDNDTKKWNFNFDMNKWCCEPGAISDTDNWFNNINEQVNILRTSIDISPVSVAKAAITHLAELNYIHKDLDWRHIGLLPILDNNNKIINLKPALIDLTSVEINTSNKTGDELIDEMLNCLNLEDV